jgi:hypothetical protein
MSSLRLESPYFNLRHRPQSARHLRAVEWVWVAEAPCPSRGTSRHPRRSESAAYSPRGSPARRGPTNLATQHLG